PRRLSGSPAQTPRIVAMSESSLSTRWWNQTRPPKGHRKNLPESTCRSTSPTQSQNENRWVAVALLDNVAEMDADTKLDALVRHDLGVALDHRPLKFNGAVHRVDDTPELDNRAVAGAFDDAAVMRVDGGIDEIAAQPPKPRQRAALVRAGEPAIADHIRNQLSSAVPAFARLKFPSATHSCGLRNVRPR